MCIRDSFSLDREEILAPQDWGFPVPISYGPGRFAEIGSYCYENQIKNPLIITDSGSVNLPFIDKLVEILKKAKVNSGIYSKISPNPRDDEISEGKQLFINNKFLARTVLPISLSYDHRIIDGAEAARFCNALKESLGKNFAYNLAF